MAGKTEREKVFEEPEILKRIQSVRTRLDDTAPEDHIAAVDGWEKKAKKALILINLKGHEGIKDIVDKARSEIRDINIILLKDRDSTRPMSPEALMAESIERQRLLDMRALWQWFLGLFDEAEFDLAQITADLDIQDADEPVETP